MHWFIISLAIASGVLQILGYFIYIRKSLRLELEPHPSTWFMFAYGTLILTVLEFDRDANWSLLILPISCTILAVVVAFMCWKRGKLKWPKDNGSRISFASDILLTVCYIGAWGFLKAGILSEYGREASTLAFLICSNLTTLTAFYPMVKEVYGDPKSEHSLPWIIWAIAYLVLGIATYMGEGFWSEFMIYPILNAILHGLIAYLARDNRQVWFDKKLSFPK